MQRAPCFGILEAGLRLASDTLGSRRSLGQTLVLGGVSVEGGPTGLLTSLKTSKSGRGRPQRQGRRWSLSPSFCLPGGETCASFFADYGRKEPQCCVSLSSAQNGTDHRVCVPTHSADVSACPKLHIAIPRHTHTRRETHPGQMICVVYNRVYNAQGLCRRSVCRRLSPQGSCRKTVLKERRPRGRRRGPRRREEGALAVGGALRGTAAAWTLESGGLRGPVPHGGDPLLGP